jgi:hypothetical protein
MSIRIAMWSGPRNISTALMRSFENRTDAHVTDEPLYASYLARTGFDHPGRDEVLASQSHDVDEVFQELLGPVPHAKAIWYQKHMAHHLPDDMSGIPLDGFAHVFLIREPLEMLTSLLRIIPNPTAAQTGLPQQVELWQRLYDRSGQRPPVIDSRDVLEDPTGVLKRLCEHVKIDFQERMLSWPKGPRATDGVWAKHWYASVLESTGFEIYKPKNEPVPMHLHDVLSECQALYETLHVNRLRA